MVRIGVAGVGLIALLIAEWILTNAIPGTQYSQGDGNMAQAVIHTALKFAGLLQLNNINPLQGIGSQMQPDNVWLNPAYWPFAVFDGPLALDASALVALGCLALACYLTARCFDVPVLPSILAAQLSITLFGPLAYLLVFYQVFWINPGVAIVYAPALVALGILIRLEPGRMSDFVLATAAIFALLLYSLSCDPLWFMISGIGLAGAFAVVVLSPLRVRPILVRGAALGCCLVLFMLTGVIGYVYTLTQYTARVLFSDAFAYVPQTFPASIVFISPKTAGSYYGICAVGWLLGLLLARGRVKVLAIAGLASFATIVTYSTAFFLMLKWWLPVPIYVEHCLFPLFTMAAVAGYWAAGVAAFEVVTRIRAATALSSHFVEGNPRTRAVALASSLPALLVVVFLPAAAVMYVVRVSPTLPDFGEPFADEPELTSFLRATVGLHDVGEFRGSIGMLLKPDDSTIYNLWLQGIPTFNEYSQLVSPQATYFSAALFKYDLFHNQINRFFPWFGRTVSYDVLFKAWQALGMRYAIAYSPFDAADERHFPSVTFPRRPVGAAPANWIVYELPNPNIGNYSPTEIVTAKSGPEIIEAIEAPQFEFTKHAVLSASIDKPLVPAHDMRLSLMRGGLHLSASSDGSSLIVLPQQFSHCLRARDTRVRLVRANLLLTGVLFSGNIDTDILFDYGIFSPGCRRADLAEVRRLIEPRRAAGEPMLVPPEYPKEPESSGPIITEETALADLPQPPTVKFIGMQGLSAAVEGTDPVVAGQPILRLVAIPTTGRHYFATQSTALNKDQVYRVTTWVKADGGLLVEMQVSDELSPRGPTPANYGTVLFDPTARRVLSVSGLLKGRGARQGPGGWQELWVDLTTSGGELILALGLFHSKEGSSFKGDGRLGLRLGGIGLTERN